MSACICVSESGMRFCSYLWLDVCSIVGCDPGPVYLYVFVCSSLLFGPTFSSARLPGGLPWNGHIQNLLVDIYSVSIAKWLEDGLLE